jgi:hypothetical protein
MKSQIALVLLLSFLVVGYVLYEKDSNNSEPKTLSERGQDSLYNQPDSDVWLNVQNLSEQHPSVAGDRLNIRARVVLGATNKDVDVSY